jgi:hypothetical protein
MMERDLYTKKMRLILFLQKNQRKVRFYLRPLTQPQHLSSSADPSSLVAGAELQPSP